MLEKYHKENRKIALGLLSFITNRATNYEDLNQLLDWALTEPRSVLLWENPTINQVSGIVIVELGATYVLLREFALSPGDRSGRNMFAIFDELHQRYPEQRLMGTLATQSLLSSWEKARYYEEKINGNQFSAPRR